MNIFKKITALAAALLLIITLTACNDNRVRVDADVRGHRTTIAVSVTLHDPEQLVSTNSFIARVFDDEDNQVQTHTFDETTTAVQEHEFTGLREESHFTVRFDVTRGGSVLTIFEVTVETEIIGATIDDPIEIGNADDFRAIRRDSSAFYRLTEDIDLEGENIPAMFTEARQFNGHLDGAGFMVHNFKMETAVRDTGLFGFIGSEGVIKDIKFENVKLDVSRAVWTNAGIIAGTNHGLIDRVTVTNASITYRATGSGRMTIGGLVGLNTERGQIIDSHLVNANLNITPRNDSIIGGLVGRNENTMFSAGIDFAAGIKDSSVRETTINITHSLSTSANINLRVGGFVALNQSSIENSVSETIIDISTNETSSNPEIYRLFVGGFVATNDTGASIKNVVTASKIDIVSTSLTTLKVSSFVADVLTFNTSFENIEILTQISSIFIDVRAEEFTPATFPSNSARFNFRTLEVTGDAFETGNTLEKYGIVISDVENLLRETFPEFNEDVTELHSIRAEEFIAQLHNVLSQLAQDNETSTFDEGQRENRFTRGDFTITLSVTDRKLTIGIVERVQRDFDLSWGIVTATDNLSGAFKNIEFAAINDEFFNFSDEILDEDKFGHIRDGFKAVSIQGNGNVTFTEDQQWMTTARNEMVSSSFLNR